MSREIYELDKLEDSRPKPSIDPAVVGKVKHELEAAIKYLDSTGAEHFEGYEPEAQMYIGLKEALHLLSEMQEGAPITAWRDHLEKQGACVACDVVKTGMDEFLSQAPAPKGMTEDGFVEKMHAWFTLPNPTLGNVSPLDTMRRGNGDAVIRLVEDAISAAKVLNLREGE